MLLTAVQSMQLADIYEQNQVTKRIDDR